MDMFGEVNIEWYYRRPRSGFKRIAANLHMTRESRLVDSFLVNYFEIADKTIGYDVPLVKLYPDRHITVTASSHNLCKHARRIKHIFKKYANCELISRSGKKEPYPRYVIRHQGLAYGFNSTATITPDGRVGRPAPFGIIPSRRLPEFDHPDIKAARKRKPFCFKVAGQRATNTLKKQARVKKEHSVTIKKRHTCKQKHQIG